MRKISQHPLKLTKFIANFFDSFEYWALIGWQNNFLSFSTLRMTNPPSRALIIPNPHNYTKMVAVKITFSILSSRYQYIHTKKEISVKKYKLKSPNNSQTRVSWSLHKSPALKTWKKA